ncbi:hypothetical protein [Pelagibius sp.]|uniref:hypothetical protein n=1 Tax=Pelagibius sp. TaxID=1931238 RepID=UPI003BB140A0
MAVPHFRDSPKPIFLSTQVLLGYPAVALRLMVAHAIGGSGLWTVNAKPQKAAKEAVSDSLAGSNDRRQVEGWLPNYIGFPFKAYTRNGGIGIEEVWGRVRNLFKVT